MQLTRKDVEKVAQLAHLEFDDSQVAEFGDQLGRIVTFVEQLSEVSTEGVEPMAHPLDVHSAVRPDVVNVGLTRDEALANSPSCDDECFRVPAVMARTS